MTRPSKWDTCEKCHKEVLKYSNITNFQSKCSGAYTQAKRNNWLTEICRHMIVTKNPRGYWTFDKCKEQALDCVNRTQLYKKSRAAHHVAYKNNWLDIFFPKS